MKKIKTSKTPFPEYIFNFYLIANGSVMLKTTNSLRGTEI